MTSNGECVTNNSFEHWTGRVKWFNNKAGYGFITITDGVRSGTDIFVHHSVINVDNQQYKYLVQGEYVEFDMVRTNSNQHEWQSSNVLGIRGGKLMCETRRELKLARNEYKTTKGDDNDSNNAVVYTHPRQKEPSDISYSSEPKREPRREPREPRREPRDISYNSEPKQRRSLPRVHGEGPREGNSKEWTLTTNKKNRTNDVGRKIYEST